MAHGYATADTLFLHAAMLFDAVLFSPPPLHAAATTATIVT